MRADLGLGPESIGSRSPEFLRNPSVPFRACRAGALCERLDVWGGFASVGCLQRRVVLPKPWAKAEAL